MDLDQKDYDHRTALHVAAAEGIQITDSCYMSVFLNRLLRVNDIISIVFVLFFISGHVEVVRFLTQTCKVNPFVKDRSESYKKKY